MKIFAARPLKSEIKQNFLLFVPPIRPQLNDNEKARSVAVFALKLEGKSYDLSDEKIN